MQVSIQFNPATETQQSVAALIAQIYGAQSQSQRPDTVNTASVAAAPQEEADDTPTATTSASGAPTVDASGLPWDARIHSTPASVNKTSGLWRAKRGVDDLTVKRVEAELRGQSAPAVPATPAPVVTPAVVAAPPVVAALPAVVPPVVAAPVPTPYESFVSWISGHITAQTSGCNEQWVSECLVAFGIADGKVSSLQAVDAETIASIRTGIAGALGVPAL